MGCLRARDAANRRLHVVDLLFDLLDEVFGDGGDLLLAHVQGYCEFEQAIVVSCPGPVISFGSTHDTGVLASE